MWFHFIIIILGKINNINYKEQKKKKGISYLG